MGDNLGKSKKVAEGAGKNALTDVLRARFHIKQHVGVNEHHRRDVRNGRTSRSRE